MWYAKLKSKQHFSCVSTFISSFKIHLIITLLHTKVIFMDMRYSFFPFLYLGTFYCMYFMHLHSCLVMHDFYIASDASSIELASLAIVMEQIFYVIIIMSSNK